MKVGREIVDCGQGAEIGAAKSVGRIICAGRGFGTVHTLYGHDVIEHWRLRRIQLPVRTDPVGPGHQAHPTGRTRTPIGTKVGHHRIDTTVLIARWRPGTPTIVVAHVIQPESMTDLMHVAQKRMRAHLGVHQVGVGTTEPYAASRREVGMCVFNASGRSPEFDIG
ncbi:MAG: hypothetical protein CAPSK01_003770 [Candidatus Accumulibacter vicinus]|uniref:Uncharacterized protein n=1 Tax=Candidatus Accumulibacter vicinus TaxID=2954382 RepID=A0A084XWI7_9PROT|nr:MAG: hypothetical protein CAPSK01_003770 [Candidatus Accumulibacter vicinus]